MEDYDNITPSKKTTKDSTCFDFSRCSYHTPTNPTSLPTLPLPPNISTPSSSTSHAIAVSIKSRLLIELGKCIAVDVALLKKLGWKCFVATRRPLLFAKSSIGATTLVCTMSVLLMYHVSR